MKTIVPFVSLALLLISIVLFVAWCFIAHNDTTAFISLFLLGCSIYTRVLGNIEEFGLVMNEVKRVIKDRSTHINLTKEEDD
jgi:sugar phosphate permease